MTTLRELMLAVSAHALAVANNAETLPELPDGVTFDVHDDYNVELLSDDWVYSSENVGNFIFDDEGNIVLWTSAGESNIGKLVIGDEGVSLVDKEGSLLGTFDDEGNFTEAEATVADGDGA